MNLQPAVNRWRLPGIPASERYVDIAGGSLGGPPRCTRAPVERDAMSMKDSVGAQDTGTSTEQLRTDIEQTRADLGDDVATLSAKMNPRARMSRALGTARGNIASATSRARQV